VRGVIQCDAFSSSKVKMKNDDAFFLAADRWFHRVKERDEKRTANQPPGEKIRSFK
jgi:hypothetical protein